MVFEKRVKIYVEFHAFPFQWSAQYKETHSQIKQRQQVFNAAMDVTQKKTRSVRTRPGQEMMRFLDDGRLEIDNNLTENAIRPVALGRKNYLFAGSHSAAQRSAMMYTFFANCKIHQVNPYDWLKYVLENINHTSIQDLHKFYPQNFTKNQPKKCQVRIIATLKVHILNAASR